MTDTNMSDFGKGLMFSELLGIARRAEKEANEARDKADAAWKPVKELARKLGMTFAKFEQRIKSGN